MIEGFIQLVAYGMGMIMVGLILTASTTLLVIVVRKVMRWMGLR